MKSVRISDETYKMIVRNAKANRRTISGTIDILVEYGLQFSQQIGLQAKTMVQTMAIEEPNEEESKPVKHYEVEDYERDYEMSDEELFAMQQRNIGQQQG